jgi:DNA-binding response OmpR family regulator
MPRSGRPPVLLQPPATGRTVASRAAALAQAAKTPVDLVLLDLGLPDLDGVEVRRRLRKAQPGCVLVMLTTCSTEMELVPEDGDG